MDNEKDRINKRIGIVGSRRRNSEEDFDQCFKSFMDIYKDGDWIVSGGCPKGGDKFAERIAKETGIPILIFYPKWKTLGKRAGFERNIKIVEHSDIIIAVVSSDRTGGTEDTIEKAKKLNKQVILVEDDWLN
jgi:hypothetical protein